MLEIVGLTKRYKNSNFYSVKDLNLTLKEGEIFGFLGKNGAGKSTTIKGIMNFISKTGEIKIFNKAFLDDEQQIKQEIGYVGGGFKFYQFKTLKKLAKIINLWKRIGKIKINFNLLEY